MKISTNPNYIFIHIPKTAGHAVTQMLNGDEHSSLGLPHWHCSARDIRKKVKNYEDYFTFAFVRHPLDRLYSMYRYNQQFIPRLKTHPCYKTNNLCAFEYDFKTWLIDNENWAGWDTNKSQLPAQKQQQSSYITDNDGNIIVNYVGKFENFDSGFNNIIKKIGITIPTILHTNKSGAKVKYRDLYNDEMIEFVKKHHRTDMELFNYGIEN